MLARKKHGPPPDSSEETEIKKMKLQDDQPTDEVSDKASDQVPDQLADQSTDQPTHQPSGPRTRSRLQWK